jgi:hypothetical protein
MSTCTAGLLTFVGNLQFLQNCRLLFLFWPLGWFSDLRVAKNRKLPDGRQRRVHYEGRSLLDCR